MIESERLIKINVKNIKSDTKLKQDSNLKDKIITFETKIKI